MSLTAAEHAAWTAAAESRGLSAWAREQVTGQLEAEQPRGQGAEVAKLRADLGRVGSNLNQLVRAVNSGHAPGGAELLEAVQATRAELARVRGELP
nr:plasmid mobilization relaxosome protein MobC [Paeniglutamicibacter cryotolerans]